jgi:hypothetical protein
VVTVTDALFADDVSGVGDEVAPPDPGYRNKGAQRLVVTINGGGDVAGEGGGQKQISLSAGGTNREIGLATDDLSGTPNFTASAPAGGNFGMVVDHPAPSARASSTRSRAASVRSSTPSPAPRSSCRSSPSATTLQRSGQLQACGASTSTCSMTLMWPL